MSGVVRHLAKVLERPNVGAAGALQSTLPRGISGWAISLLTHGSWVLILSSVLLVCVHAPQSFSALPTSETLGVLFFYCLYTVFLEIASRKFSHTYDRNSFRIARVAVNTIAVGGLVYVSGPEKGYFWVFYALPIFQSVVYFGRIGIATVFVLETLSYWIVSWVSSNRQDHEALIQATTLNSAILLLVGLTFLWLFRSAKSLRRLEQEEIDALSSTALDITAQLDRQLLLETIIRRSAELLGAKGGGIYDYDEERQELTVIADWGTERSIVGHKLNVGEGMAGLVAQTRQSQIVDDYSIWSGRSIAYEPDLFHAVVEVPLASRDGFLGVLYVTDKGEGGKFTERDAQLLRLLAGHAAIAISNADVFAKSNRNFRQLQLLYEVNSKLSVALNLDDMLRLTLREGSKAVGTSDGSIMILDPKTNTLEVKTWMVRGKFINERPNHSLHIGEGIAGHVVGTVRPYNCPDTETDKLFVELSTSTKPRSVICVPITSRGRVLGVINADSDRPKFFRESDIQLLGALASHLAIAIEAQKLRDIGIYLSTVTLDDLYATVVENACILTGAEASTVVLLNKKDELERAASFPPSKQLEDPPRRKGGLTDRILKTGLLIKIKNAQKDPRVKQPVKEGGVKSIMGAPLNVRLEQGDDGTVKTIGVLFVTTTRALHFNERDEELLRSLANQAAIAITKAQLYEEVRVERDRSADLAAQFLELYNYAKDMQSELELPNLLNLIAAQGATLLKADAGAILLLDDQEKLQLRGGYGLKQDVGRHDEIDDEHLINVIQTRKSVAKQRVATDFRFSGLEAEKILGYISAPLWIDNRFIGRLDVYSRTNVRPFSEDDVQMLQLVADQASIAISRRLRSLHEFQSIRKLPWPKLEAGSDPRLSAVVRELQREKLRRVRAERDAEWKDISFSAAHAIGNPIFAIETILDPLERRILDGRWEDAVEILSRVRLSVEKAKKFVDQFKSLTRAQDIRPVPMLLPPLLEDIRSVASDKEVNCTIKCPPDLYVQGEADRLAECFDELTSNAIHWLALHLGAASELEIEVSPAPIPVPRFLESNRQYVLIHFKDNGPGVAQSDKAKIFDLFFSKREHGTGIGLAFIRRIIEGHGGTISEIGIPGQGCTFEIYLPLADVSDCLVKT